MDVFSNLWGNEKYKCPFWGIKIILGKEDDRRLVAIFLSCFAFKMPFRNTAELAHVCSPKV